MKKLLLILFAAAVTVTAFAASETREIRLIQDDAQVRLVTKVYQTKHLTRAAEIVSFVTAAIRRYYSNSLVRALNASPQEQYLLVTTADKFIPYVDQIIATLDRGTVKDKFGSVVEGSGYRWQVFYPMYRRVDDLAIAANMMLSGVGTCHISNGALWLKDDTGDIEYTLDWVKYFDRPVPQAKFTFRYYYVRESTLRDIGIDYLAWKNGPGMNLLDLAFSNGKFSWDKALNTAAMLGLSSTSWSTFGCLTAPAFDMSFIRLLQQSGSAKIAATAEVTMVSGQDKATLALTPTYNALRKDPDNHASSVVPINLADLQLTVYNPTFCFFTESKDLNEYGWIPFSSEFYAKNNGSALFQYELISSDAVEGNNYGAQIGSSTQTGCSKKTIHFGKEQILSYGCRDYDVEQTTGVPFLCQLPVLKYIFGTTTTIKEKNYMYVTVEVNLVHPETAGIKLEPVKTPVKAAAKADTKAEAKPAAKTDAKTDAKSAAKPAEAAKK